MTALLEQTMAKIQQRPSVEQDAIAKYLDKHVDEIVAKIEEGVSKGQQAIEDDPWDNLDFDQIAVDTGISDFAENHDHYLYGVPKREKHSPC